MDIRDLKFADNVFDVAIDKGMHTECWSTNALETNRRSSGTMDAMMTSKGDVWVSETEDGFPYR